MKRSQDMRDQILVENKENNQYIINIPQNRFASAGPHKKVKRGDRVIYLLLNNCEPNLEEPQEAHRSEPPKAIDMNVETEPQESIDEARSDIESAEDPEEGMPHSVPRLVVSHL